MFNCPICKNPSIISGQLQNRETDNNEIYELNLCKRCSFYFIDPGQITNQQKDQYPDYFYSKETNRNILGKLFLLVENILYHRRVINFSAIKTVNNAKSVLDIGAGNGKFLNAMQKAGWQVFGVETSPSGIKSARDNFDIISITDSIDKIQNNSFDLITMWHVLEHISNPEKYLFNIKKLLNKNGKLFIAVPNIDCLEAKLFKNNWPYWDAPRHVNYFNTKSLSILLNQAGFKIIKISTFRFEYNFTSWILTLGNAICGQYNFLYRKLKRQESLNIPRLKTFFCYITYCLLFILSPVIILLILILSIFNNGSSLEITAKINN